MRGGYGITSEEAMRIVVEVQLDLDRIECDN